MKVGYKKIFNIFLFLFVFVMLFGCSKKEVINNDSDYKTNYGYKYFLSKENNQAKLYEDAYKKCLSFDSNKTSFSKSNYTTLFEAKCDQYDLTLDEMKQVFNIFIYENPMFYFLNEIDYEDGGDYISFDVSKDYYNYNDRKKYNKKINDGIKEIDSKISSIKGDYEKVLFIYNYIDTNMTYCKEDEGDLYYAHNILGFFDNKKGVCESNSEAFYLLCKRYGIDCRFAYSEGHVWNLAKVYDMWFMFDLTYRFFGISEGLYFQENHDEVLYDNLMIPLPDNLCVSSLSYGEFILYEDDTELYRSHNIEDVYKHFNGGDYKIVLDSSKIEKQEDKIFYIDSFDYNYNSLYYLGTKSPGDDGFAIFDGYMLISKNLEVSKSMDFRAINFMSYHDSLFQSWDRSISVTSSAKVIYSTQAKLVNFYFTYDGKEVKKIYELNYTD